MSMRALFAKNLKRLCATQKSYAHVARELGVNRQQFDSYIKGRNLPNEGVVERICAYFQVDIGTLFRDHDPGSEFASIDALVDKHKKMLNGIIADETSARRGGLVDGKYHVYFSVPNDPDSFVCSLLAVRREGGFVTFRRITRTITSSLTLRGVNFGLHSGVVLFREGQLFFVGVARANEAAPSFLVANELLSREVLFGGKAIVHAGTNFHIVKFCIVPIPPRTKVWKAMRQATVLSRAEITSISPAVGAFFEAGSV
jgi:transcriptional regulator with XRE-family HTH domain